MKDSSASVPSSITEGSNSFTDPKDIADALDNYFSKVANGIRSSIKHSRNKFFDFLPQIDINSFFMNSTDKNETKNILSYDSLKSIGSNSIPTKILKLLSKDVSTLFTELLNLSFSESVFASILKTYKVIPIYKKDSQLNFSNYQLTSLLSKIPQRIKFFKTLCIIACRNF